MFNSPSLHAVFQVPQHKVIVKTIYTLNVREHISQSMLTSQKVMLPVLLVNAKVEALKMHNDGENWAQYNAMK